MKQIEENNCPPNPAKLTDSRSSGYLRKFGNESWELDALEPSYLVNLVERHISAFIDPTHGSRRRSGLPRRGNNSLTPPTVSRGSSMLKGVHTVLSGVCGNRLRVISDGEHAEIGVETPHEGVSITLTREQARRLIDTMATMLDEGESDVSHFEG